MLGDGELFAIVKVPPTGPTAVGANVAEIVVDLLAATEIGNEMPCTEKPGPEAVIFEMLSAALPLFEIVNVCELLEPIAIFAKS